MAGDLILHLLILCYYLATRDSNFEGALFYSWRPDFGVAVLRWVMSMFLQGRVTGFALVILSVVSSTAYGHKVNVFAYVEGDQIFTEGYFSDGTRAKNSEVTVYDTDSHELTKGQTNEEGVFTFPTQGKQSLRIILNAGLGHQASYEIPVDELAGPAGPSKATTMSPSAGQAASLNASNAGSGSDEYSQISEAMVRKAVAQGVLPLALEISELKERRGFSDIVGGIGFIVGLLGIFAYFKARQEVRKIKGQ